MVEGRETPRKFQNVKSQEESQGEMTGQVDISEFYFTGRALLDEGKVKQRLVRRGR